uniref:Uncharacterized protein n=1 Tax=Ananas comosus var. bracteatus TaxID=296719 RepID=A0A6V7PK63_ANACO|nr:unnamed protein product [Ananas comosus var. bracteatus]
MAEFGVAVVGWVASPIIKAMVDTVRSYIESRLPWRSAVEGELHTLATVLTQILAVVSTAESLPATDNESHLALLRQMKDAVYEAEDLLDEFGYLLLQSEVNSGCKVSLPSACFSSVGVSFRNKLKKVLSKLEKVKACAQTFLDIVGATVTTVAGSSSSSGVAMPSSFYRLYYLQVLDVSRSGLPTWSPEGLDKLINLRVLNVHEAFASQIARIGKLTSLQGLAEFRTSKKNGRKMVELQNMNELQGSLRIKNLENVDSMQEAAEAKLNRKEYIKKLRYQVSDMAGDKLVVASAILDSELLRILDISPPLGRLPHLKFLEIRWMCAVKKISFEFYANNRLKGFALLEHLRFEGMPELVEWSQAKEYRAFPSLCGVQIEKCPKLTDEAFSSCLQTLIRLSSLEISCCHRLISLPSASVLRHLTTLKELYIKCCENLASLGGLHALTSLKELELTDCPKLLASMIIGEDNYDRGFLPASLASLRIVRCGLTDASLSNCLQNLASLSTLEIKECRQITTLPSKQVMRHLTALKQLRMRSCQALTSLGGLSNLSSLKLLAVAVCPRLLESTNADGENGQVILPSVLESLELNSCGVNDNSLSVCLQNLSSLSALCIYCCNGIVSLPPATVFRRLTMLAKLDIFDCQELTSAVGLSALTRRRFVRIVSCPKLADLSSISSQLWAYLD